MGYTEYKFGEVINTTPNNANAINYNEDNTVSDIIQSMYTNVEELNTTVSSLSTTVSNLSTTVNNSPKFAVLTTTVNSSYNFSVSLPSGWSQSNSYIVDIEMKSGTSWYKFVSVNGTYGVSPFHSVCIGSNNVVSGSVVSTGYAGASVRIVVGKI